MDIRNPVISADYFLMALAEYQENHQPVSLLLDQQGLARMEGFVVNIHADEVLLKTTIELDNGHTFTLKDLLAVNGLFRSDYSEC